MADYYVKCEFPIITAITKANPGAVTTEAAHGLTTGDVIGISNVSGMTQVNNAKFTVTVTSSTTFTLGVDTTSYTTYTGAGYVHGGVGSGSYRGPWLPSAAFALGDRAFSLTVNNYAYECTTAGTSGATIPTFGTNPGNTATDNTVVWTTREGTTWANALTACGRVYGFGPATDRAFVSSSTKEVVFGNGLSFFGGTPCASFISVDATSGEPPTTIAAGATLVTLGASTLQLTNNTGPVPFYCYGFTFAAGSGTDSGSFRLSNRGTRAIFENCRFELRGNNSASRTILISAGDVGNYALYRNCVFKFANASQRFTVGNGVTIEGGSIDSSGSALTSPFLHGYTSGPTEGTVFLVSGMDLSAISTSASLISSAATYNASTGVFRNCKLPASFSGTLITGTVPRLARFDLYNTDSTDTNYRIEVKDSLATLTQDTGIYRSGGATNGTTAMSWKIVTTTLPNFTVNNFYSAEIVRWNETTGSSITVTVETLTDNVTLKDDECWLEVMYLGTSGYPLGTWISDAKASPVATAANQPTSSATWTTTGITTPVKQYLSVSFTPQEKGFIHARVCVGKASTTVYVDPKLTVS